jgi:hypothetical protein
MRNAALVCSLIGDPVLAARSGQRGQGGVARPAFVESACMARTFRSYANTPKRLSEMQW